MLEGKAAGERWKEKVGVKSERQANICGRFWCRSTILKQEITSSV